MGIEAEMTMTATYTPKIREFVKKTIIEPARAQGDHAVLIRVGDVHKAMKLVNPDSRDLQRPPESCVRD